jgi:hypothetical protein
LRWGNCTLREKKVRCHKYVQYYIGVKSLLKKYHQGQTVNILSYKFHNYCHHLQLWLRSSGQYNFNSKDDIMK